MDTRAQYNTQFVTHEGDVVQNIDAVAAEWTRASQAMSTLENADMPYSIVPGNHDISTTGTANQFDATFPPSRFQGESWYGGYMGDANDAIPESTNRLNKDSYQLFEVGGLKFLMVSIEVGMPQYSVDWAKALVQAYPDRRVIITTHAFIDASGARPTSPVHRVDGVSAASVWTQLIQPNCNIDFVLNGHYHGEARRNDLNSCGEPVHQILADYQDDPNGGDGWLRMMTFRPELNQVDVITYSPTETNSTRDPDHDGFEETAAGQFSLPVQHVGQRVGADRDRDQRRLRGARHRAVERSADRHLVRVVRRRQRRHLLDAGPDVDVQHRGQPEPGADHRFGHDQPVEPEDQRHAERDRDQPRP